MRAGCAALNTEEDDEWVSGVRFSGSFGRKVRERDRGKILLFLIIKKNLSHFPTKQKIKKLFSYSISNSGVFDSLSSHTED